MGALGNFVDGEGIARTVIIVLFMTTIGCFSYTWGYYEGIHNAKTMLFLEKSHDHDVAQSAAKPGETVQRMGEALHAQGKQRAQRSGQGLNAIGGHGGAAGDKTARGAVTGAGQGGMHQNRAVNKATAGAGNAAAAGGMKAQGKVQQVNAANAA